MGQLVLLTLPLGNIGDITERVKNALRDGEFFACEDTRNLVSLLGHLGIESKPKTITSYHEHSKEEDLEKIFKLISQGKTVYYCSDAGSPIVSDPCYKVVKRAKELNIPTTSYPGASAPIMALELSSLPPVPFQFLGFFPRDKAKQAQILERLKVYPGTSIFFESPHRAEKTLDLISSQLPEAELSVLREGTKKFESVVHFKARDFNDNRDLLNFRGEMTFCLAHPALEDKTALNTQKILELARDVLEQKGRTKVLAKLLGEILNESPKVLYDKLNLQK